MSSWRVHGSQEQEGGIVFNKLPSKPDEEEDEQDEFVEPPASALHRRRALVPPKVTYAFCKEFISFIIASMNSGDFNTTDVLLKLFKKSTKATALRQAYHRYTLNYINALNYLETLRRQVEFNEFEKWCSRDPRCKKLQLTDLLVSPVQHIMRVPLILKDIEMRTEDVEERDSITAILEAEENSLRELDDKMKWLKNFERLLEIQRNIIWPSVTELDPKAFIPEKSSITENWASTCSKGNSIHEGGFKYVVYKQPLSLDRICIHDVTVQDGSGNWVGH
ncbi:hypothetical protein IscW_ISCW010836 [Ixodes scapularis]|uniref:DH domain-containing protein n=1 Tax=Ixodes scapularis TaxID=6945 RepID=B7Q8E5_IXOSC|nr:hypothetical protein IscW_ISCW010836 [Ixodes scapularis]|eukprot:XP_002404981.1 hypothetical protein IscW_ISCW010836 [Ixodes scapularis]